MKNKFLISIIFFLILINNALSNSFKFESSNIEITDNGNIISSTKDIFNRSGVKGDQSVCDPGMVYYIGESDEIYSEGEELYDLQELSYV